MRFAFSMACLAALLILVAGGSVAGQRSAKSGAYTKAQAERGKSLFDKQCLGCHADPKFGYGVIDDRTGTPAAELFEFVRTSMPEDNPGSLKPAQYADILAYFFSLRGLPPGDAELDVEGITELQIEKP
jgi:quinoprotein glucose dehydrogenase